MDSEMDQHQRLLPDQCTKNMEESGSICEKPLVQGCICGKKHTGRFTSHNGIRNNPVPMCAISPASLMCFIVGFIMLALVANRFAPARYIGLQYFSNSNRNEYYQYKASRSDHDHEYAGHDTVKSFETAPPAVLHTSGETFVTSPSTTLPPSESKCAVSVPSRLDCFPDRASNETSCRLRGCCWVADPGDPYCFFPIDQSSTYDIMSVVHEDVSMRVVLERAESSSWPGEVTSLNLLITPETSTRLNFKLFDPAKTRYEVPISTPQPPSVEPAVTDYGIVLGEPGDPLSFSIIRKSTRTVLFDCTDSPLIFSDQLLQLTTKVPSKYLYGLGEMRGGLLHNTDIPKSFTMWNHDQAPTENSNLYGTHPLAIGLEPDGNAYGIFLLNSNAMDVSITSYGSPRITYTSTGGILDFYMYTGPTIDDVVRQHTTVIGRPFLPPYWSLGYHLCRWGYNNSQNMEAVVTRMRNAKIPYDTQWNDIDYMSQLHDWTYNQKDFGGLPTLVKNLHDNEQHYIMIVDPGIPNTPGYPPYDQGAAAGVFMKDSNGTADIVGRVWPGNTVFPDFWHPNATKWWTNQAKSLHDIIPFDGLWTDMNEPSNFVDGSLVGCPEDDLLNVPPWLPPGINGGDLKFKTVCPSARHHIGSHYNLHNLYGYSEQLATQQALHSVRPGLRTLVISRSTFSGSGQFGGHWTGDNHADWDNLRYSVPAILSMNLFGIPFVGADICGFSGNTTQELCVRWHQLGAFYPFMRNHNMLAALDQDPAADWFELSAREAMKAAISLRYSLLPYLYTLLVSAHIDGSPVARPLVAQYPRDPNTYANAQQILWGDGLLISPVLHKGATTVSAYIPTDTWYDWYTGEPLTGTGQTATLPAPLDVVPIHQRAGTIIATQEAGVTTAASRRNNFTLVVAVGGEGTADGMLIWDDGESLDSVTQDQYTNVTFHVTNWGTLTSVVHTSGYNRSMSLNCVKIRGSDTVPTFSTLNGKAIKVNTDNPLEPVLYDFLTPLSESITIRWF